MTGDPAPLTGTDLVRASAQLMVLALPEAALKEAAERLSEIYLHHARQEAPTEGSPD